MEYPPFSNHVRCVEAQAPIQVVHCSLTAKSRRVGRGWLPDSGKLGPFRSLPHAYATALGGFWSEATRSIH